MLVSQGSDIIQPHDIAVSEDVLKHRASLRALGVLLVTKLAFHGLSPLEGTFCSMHQVEMHRTTPLQYIYICIYI